jgi:hypothetical protein
MRKRRIGIVRAAGRGFCVLIPFRLRLTAESDLICPCDFNSSQRPSFNFDSGSLQVEPFRL